jgi:transposase
LGISYVTANNVVKQFEELGLLKETTGGQRNRRYRYEPYLALFETLDKPGEQEKRDD